MSIPAILLPVFVQVALAFVLLIHLGAVRASAIRAGGVDEKRVVLDDTGWPVNVRQVSNCLRNQFEFPVLFYALVAFALITRQADLPFVVLSWIFVLSRLVHAAVHVTSNNVRLRFPAFALGVLALLIMWMLFAIGILFSPVMP
ncbi:MAPEG family protein [Ancylobacter pratisalsi]|uniref:MAPEG family protein n=1 Tax=Ancylobacter pratisalsi TaxID=1745854 RepID=A0A6P1YQD3_9HYPH|nr:MAPEG family protein [Ancylobacter pratisalsi]QIB35255.1 MAPEG family protein [Ancylobacter pratisalsi]